MTEPLKSVKFYACDYDYEKELKFLLHFTDFNLNTCHDLICIIHKCQGDYTINNDKILVEHIQQIRYLFDFCVNNKLNYTIEHNMDHLYSSIYNEVHPKHIDYSCEIKIKSDDRMTEHKVSITIEDDFGRTVTKVKTRLSTPMLMDKILELEEVE